MKPLSARSLLLILLIAHTGAQADPSLGRLFLDAQQRARLDLQRQRNPGFMPNADEGSLTINGEVRASNGKRTRWINGQADWNGTIAAPPLAVGDTLDQTTGERTRIIKEDAIRIRRAPGTPP